MEKVNQFTGAFSVIIPTMWRSRKIRKMLPLYEAAERVKEVIIIDNNPGKRIRLANFSKVVLLEQNENIFVNPAWNRGAAVAKHDLIFANDDIVIENLNEVLDAIAASHFGVEGMCTRSGDFGPVRIDEITTFPQNSYGCFLAVAKYAYVPEQLKIWYGDYLQFLRNHPRGIVVNAAINDERSITINSDRAYFRGKIGQNDIKEWEKLTEASNMNVIVRTSNRPLYFSRCMESVRRWLPNTRVVVTCDNPADMDYIRKCTAGMNYAAIMINREVVQQICSRIPIERKPFVSNYYLNIVRPFVNGWCMVLDDDDELLATPTVPLYPDEIVIHRVNVGHKVVPAKLLAEPVLNDINSSCIVFHSSRMEDWNPQRGGDFDFISKMYKNNKVMISDTLVAAAQTGGNFGNRTDLKDKPVSVNLATYPARKISAAAVINQLCSLSVVDIVRVYLNEYEAVPECFPKHKKVTYHLGENVMDSGKFYWAGTLKNEYYFSADDDLMYTETYFKNHLKALKTYKGCFVTSHGKLLKPQPKAFNDCTISIRCLNDLANDTFLNNGGTGVMAFDNSVYAVLPSMFRYHGMADMWISLYCQQRGIPIVCRAHRSNELRYTDHGDTLFDRRFNLHENHMKIVNSIPEWKVSFKPPSLDSKQYWESRYASGNNSGAGSYKHLGQYKAGKVNEFIKINGVKTVIDMGCGDGNVASMLRDFWYYVGYDVSESAVSHCRKYHFSGDGRVLFTNTLPDRTFDLALSMDVIFHLVEDDVFEAYMRQLLAFSDRWVLI